MKENLTDNQLNRPHRKDLKLKCVICLDLQILSLMSRKSLLHELPVNTVTSLYCFVLSTSGSANGVSFGRGYLFDEQWGRVIRKPVRKQLLWHTSALTSTGKRDDIHHITEAV